MKNPGFSLIAEEIFLNLNIQELVNCRLVSSFWREFIDGHKSLVLKKLKWTMINRRNRDGKTVVENLALSQNPFAQNLFDTKSRAQYPYNLKISSLKISGGYKIPTLKTPTISKSLRSKSLQGTKSLLSKSLQSQNPFA